ncbi:hypothetical protein PROFUN_03116 [Planoprotostelium fungivorum]|uniref:PPPDE domain-containing protein n=1 Tax=Planoprotostelium fungivorum TaxID=1890364 RepID=A0A2P6NQ96_9EUKA|nr:hypothetical protein PROFUN_03116 [Planoprotostelium fungivorum]
MEAPSRVTLHVYDLSQGLARQLSMGFLGKYIEGVWHTGIVAFNREFFWGGVIQESKPGVTTYGSPTKVIHLGETHIPEDIFREWLSEKTKNYDLSTYSLLSNNCNNFSNEVCQFLCGSDIPGDILNLPMEVLNSPNGGFFRQLITQMENGMRQQALAGGPVNQAQQGPPSIFSGYQMPQNPSLPSSSTTSQLPPSTISQPTPSQPAPQPIPAPVASITTSQTTHLTSDAKCLISDSGSIVPFLPKLKQLYATLRPSDAQNKSATLDSLKIYLEESKSTEKEPEEKIYQLFDEIFLDYNELNKSNSSLLLNHLFMFRFLILRSAPAIRYTTTHKHVLNHIFTHFISLEDTFSTVTTMSFTVASNLFGSDRTRIFLEDSAEQLITLATRQLSDGKSKPPQQVAAGLLYNYSLRLKKGIEDSNSVLVLTSLITVTDADPIQIDEEATYRLLLTLGHLLKGNDDLRALAKELAPDFEDMTKKKMRETFPVGRIHELLREITL